MKKDICSSASWDKNDKSFVFSHFRALTDQYLGSGTPQSVTIRNIHRVLNFLWKKLVLAAAADRHGRLGGPLSEVQYDFHTKNKLM